MIWRFIYTVGSIISDRREKEYDHPGGLPCKIKFKNG